MELMERIKELCGVSNCDKCKVVRVCPYRNVPTDWDIEKIKEAVGTTEKPKKEKEPKEEFKIPVKLTFSSKETAILFLEMMVERIKEAL